MSYESEIKKLERRWEENPKQYFAPLADAYRKNGDYAKALELIHEGLGERPDYVSAHIVLGRTHVDMAEFEEASRVFEQVLDLDAENIIALNQLAVLAEQADDNAGAVRWLGRLLEVDPMNDEAVHRMEELSAGAAPAEEEWSEIPVEPVSDTTPAPAGDGVSFADVLDDGGPGAEEEASQPETVPEADATIVDLEAVSAIPEPEAVTEPRRPALDEVETAVVEAVTTDDAESEDDAAEETPAIAEMDTLKMQGIGEHVVDLDAASAATDTPPEEPEVEEVPEPLTDIPLLEDVAQPESEEVPEEAVPEEPVQSEPAAAPVADPDPEPVVTETMARVYAEQGMIDEARDVYRELLQRKPGDERLEAELAGLDTAQKAAPQQAAPRYSVVQTGGTSARSMLHEMLSATVQSAPVVEAAEPFSAPRQNPSKSRLSFDDFYGAAGPGDASSDDTAPDDAAGGDDFKDWLKGLKS